MKISKILAETENNIIADAISYITIIDIIIRYPHNRNSAIYITTDDLKTIDVEKMEELVAKYSSELIEIVFQIPENKHNSVNGFTENKDLVCIFITELKN
jgi:hypothetical protein